jgi:hypothetical protein
MLQEKINALWAKLIIIGIAIGIAPPVLYTAIVYYLQNSDALHTDIEPQMLQYLSYILIGIAVVVILPLINLIKNLFRKRAETPVPSSRIQGEPTFGNTVAPILTSSYIIIAAICEGVAIFGLVLGILGGKFEFVLALEFLSIAYFLFYSFKKNDIEEMAYRSAKVNGILEVTPENQ